MKKSRFEIFMEAVQTGGTLSQSEQLNNRKESISNDLEEISRLLEQGSEREILDFIDVFIQGNSPNSSTYKEHFNKIKVSSPASRKEYLCHISKTLENFLGELGNKTDKQ